MTIAPGARLGPYEILAPLGAGGMGEVLRARDTKLGREVAVKVLPDHLASDPRALLRFEAEAKAVASLSHPHILAIHDFGRIDGVSFAVTELLEGEPLRALVTRGPIPTKRALEIASQLADALASAHEKGIVHRDVKPENVFLTRDGRVKLLDFGLACHSAPLSDPSDTRSPTAPVLTDAGALLGTVSYMSPQQARGLSVDHRADQFSLGVVLYEMLSGKRPFVGASGAETLAAIIRDEPESLATAAPSAPIGVRLLIERCLAKVPEDRYESTRDLAREIATWKVQISGAPAGRGFVPTTTGGSAKARRRFVVALAGALALAVVAGVSIWMRHRGATPSPGASAAPAAAPVDSALAGLDPKRVAVAIFENRTGDPSLEDVGRMAADWITEGLSRVSGLDVVSSDLVSQLAEAADAASRKDPVRLLGEQTGAGLVVSGAVYASGADVRLQARVTDAVTGALVYAPEPASAPRKDPMPAVETFRVKVRDAVAARILGSSQPGFLAGYRNGPRPPRFEAYREFLAGMEPYRARSPAAIPHFRKALELDPDFVEPRFLLLSAYLTFGPPEEVPPLLEELERRRGDLTPVLRHTLDSLRADAAGRLDDALVAARAASREAPGDVLMAWQVALYALWCNRPREAVEVLDRPLRWTIPPKPGPAVGAGYYNVLTFSLHLLGEHERELNDALRSRRFYPWAGFVQIGRALVALGRLGELEAAIEKGRADLTEARLAASMVVFASELRAHGRHAESVAMARRAVLLLRGLPPKERQDVRELTAAGLELAEGWQDARTLWRKTVPDVSANGDVDRLLSLGAIAGRLGATTEARRLDAELEKLQRPGLSGQRDYARAAIHATLGEKEKAVELLRTAIAEGLGGPGDRGWTDLGHTHWPLESLRGYPPFEELVKPRE